jgi:hypothetical protein
VKWVLVVVVVLAALGVDFGIWWTPFLAGAVIGIVEPRARIAVPIGAGIGLLMWGYPLSVIQLKVGLVPTAQSLAAIMGFGHQGLIPVLLTCVVGLLLGLCGAWLGSAVRTLIQPAISR